MAEDVIRVLVCGSRSWPGGNRMIESTLDGIRQRMGKDLVIIEGGATGADASAARWARQYDMIHHQYPADWKTHGKRAGYLRNVEMLEKGKPDLVLAFVDKALPESKGTNMMVKLAKEAGVKTYVIEKM